jgi:hypothetical protein
MHVVMRLLTLSMVGSRDVQVNQDVAGTSHACSAAACVAGIGMIMKLAS